MMHATFDKLWNPETDKPEDHPLWDLQVQAEYGMMRAGADKFRAHVDNAKKRGEMTRVQPVTRLMDDWVPRVADMLRSIIRSNDAARGGPKPIAQPYLKMLDPYLMAVVGVREVLNCMSSDKPAILSLATRIGATLEYELRVQEWAKKDPGSFHRNRKEMTEEGATNWHRRRVNIHQMKEYIETGRFSSDMPAWGTIVKERVGLTVVDAIIKATGWVEIIDDPHYKWRKGKNATLVLSFKPGVYDWLDGALDAAELMMPEYRATLMPPRRWTSARKGGYWTPYVKPRQLVRFKASQEAQREGAIDEYDALAYPDVLDAVNMLQETAWCINHRVHAVFSKVWTELRWTDVKKLPCLSEKPLPVRTPRMVEHRKRQDEARARGAKTLPEPDAQTAAEIEIWKRAATPVYRYNATRVARSRSTGTILRLADEYAKHEAFYFPHMLDFRGRIYPIPSHLTPQGNDLSRGLLTYATSAPISEANGGVRWLAIHLASMWGFDKEDLDFRVQWVKDNEAMLRAVAADPITSRDWVKADSPWQALAACFEWVDYLNYGDGFMSSLPITVDGTCNGIQHLAALTRDPVAGRYVNLLPAEKPQDIYKFVAGKLEAKFLEIISAGGQPARKAQWWLNAAGGSLTRGMTKRQVMVLPYGGTKESYFEYTWEWVNENLPEPPEGRTQEEKEELAEMVTFFALHLWDIVNDVAELAVAVMDWLKKCAKVAAVANQPIFWKVPSGFVVRHFYGTIEERRIKLSLDGTTHYLRAHDRTTTLSLKEQLQGISPNFIHSLDASALVTCIKLCREDGIVAFTSIHDAYGTHAANMDILARNLREAFVWTHEHDVLGAFRQACIEVALPVYLQQGMDILDAYEKLEEELPEPMELGGLDIKDVLRSPYFFH